MDLKGLVRKIPDFPKKGVLFFDITTLLENNESLHEIQDRMARHYIRKDFVVDKVVSMESRGFIFGAMLASAIHAGFVPLRKPGKLPYKKIRQEFKTEYSTDCFEVHEDAIKKGENCIIADDLLATGGTAEAAIGLVEKMGGNVKGLFFLISLDYLDGRKRLRGKDIFSIINFSEEK